MSTCCEHLTRNFLTIRGIARRYHCNPALLRKAWKAGLIPWPNANPSGKQPRFVDSPEIGAFCKGLQSDPNLIAIIEGTVLEIIRRDYFPDLVDKMIIPEMYRQLSESNDPDQLLKKWERARVEGRPKDLPHISLAHLGSEALAEMLRQLLDSKDPGQLLKKWGRAIVDRRPGDLPRAS